MAKFAIHVNPGGATFVKDYDYFVGQGGLTQMWDCGRESHGGECRKP